MARSAWQNLNGLWDYAITGKDAFKPASFDGQILVPFPLESALSGVKRALQPSQLLWYKRSFIQPSLTNSQHLLLHFGAVDWQTTLFVNGKEVGTHTGGYTEFTFDITEALKSGSNELLVRVYDPSDQGIGPHGKQVLNPANIYYTPSSGIWQTVWLETVASDYVKRIRLTPDIDASQLAFSADVASLDKDIKLEAVVYHKQQVIARFHGDQQSGFEGRLPIPSAHLWSPTDPFLYDLVVRLKHGNKVLDEVKSYFGMRKISIAKDSKGIDRICLNNQPYFNLGTLDQGFWPDGLYTAPTDEALAFDIKAIKSMGFNTIRKHIKVEPARWYYEADKQGMLVWQDMVNPNQRLPEGSKSEFERESAEILSQLHNYPSIICWVLFNEKWGQYDQDRLTKWIKKTDPSRIVNGHTGELLYVNEKLRSPSPNAYIGADMTDVHSYPDPMISIKQPGKAQVVGEFGGIGVFIPDHQWNSNSAWGYIQEKPAGLLAKYKIMNQHLKLLEAEGLSASIYTQPFDVEGEQNGLMTYDREVVKIPFADLRKIHAMLNPDVIKASLVTAKDADLTEPGLVYSAQLDQYIAGKREPAFLKRMAMLAVQAGDKPGADLAGKAYIAALKTPLSDDDRTSVTQFTKSTKDPGYSFMIADSAGFQKVMGARKYTLALMNMVYKGELEQVINAGNPDWKMLEEKIKPFGEPGEEIFLRAKTVEYINKQDWPNYVPAARAYLAKYGQNLSEKERSSFQQAIDQHQ
jgi:beta-galactosidase/beta-glucuronidase